jgi:hypothetical protein
MMGGSCNSRCVNLQLAFILQLLALPHLTGKDRRSLSASGSGLSPESPRASSVNMTSLAMQSSLLPFSSASSGPNSFSNNNASPAFDQHGRSRANSTGSTGGSGVSNATFSLLSPDEFLPFVIPFQGGAGVLAGELHQGSLQDTVCCKSAGDHL